MEAVHVHGMTVHDEHTLPLGGVKDSGWGRFNRPGAVEAFTWSKNMAIGNDGGHLLALHLL